jgi:hypothetical protein
LQDVAIAQARAGDVSGGLETARRIKGSFQFGALLTIAIAQAKAGDVAGCEQTVRMLSPGKDRCVGYIDLAKTLLKDPQATDDEER